MRSPESKAPDSQSWVIASLCAYEVAAILSRERLPTLSRLQKRFRPLGAFLVLWMVIHFIRYEERRAALLAGEVADQLMSAVEEAAQSVSEGESNADHHESTLADLGHMVARLRLHRI
jgi:hypothetical protein